MDVYFQCKKQVGFITLLLSFFLMDLLQMQPLNCARSQLHTVALTTLSDLTDEQNVTVYCMTEPEIFSVLISEHLLAIVNLMKATCDEPMLLELRNGTVHLCNVDDE